MGWRRRSRIVVRDCGRDWTCAYEEMATAAIYIYIDLGSASKQTIYRGGKHTPVAAYYGVGGSTIGGVDGR